MNDNTAPQTTIELLQQRNQELALLHRVSHMFSSSLDLDHVLKTVLSEMRRLLDITATSFWLRIPETGKLICQQSIGPESKTVIGWQLAPGQGIVGKAAQTGYFPGWFPCSARWSGIPGRTVHSRCIHPPGLFSRRETPLPAAHGG